MDDTLSRPLNRPIDPPEGQSENDDIPPSVTSTGSTGSSNALAAESGPLSGEIEGDSGTGTASAGGSNVVPINQPRALERITDQERQNALRNNTYSADP